MDIYRGYIVDYFILSLSREKGSLAHPHPCIGQLKYWRTKMDHFQAYPGETSNFAGGHYVDNRFATTRGSAQRIGSSRVANPQKIYDYGQPGVTRPQSSR